LLQNITRGKNDQGEEKKDIERKFTEGNSRFRINATIKAYLMFVSLGDAFERIFTNHVGEI
jgi:hypothetical protein